MAFLTKSFILHVGLHLLFCCSLKTTSKLHSHSMRMRSRTGLNTEIPAFLNTIQSKQGKDIDTTYIFLYTEEDHIPLTPGRSSVEQGFSGGGKKSSRMLQMDTTSPLLTQSVF